MTHLYRKHIAATYLERSGEISPMCIRDAFPLQVGGTDSAVSPAPNESLTVRVENTSLAHPQHITAMKSYET